ncbi:MAG: aminopeptidase P family protein [Ignavibacteria bacterium]|nr:aminopeptidase P family protein [Ignavibacteria bacterium]
MDLTAIQTALTKEGIDGWLFYDFHNRDAIAARILNMDTKRFASRRWFYYIPAKGEPQKLVHSIEPWRCDHLPGKKNIYLPWQQQQQSLKDILCNAKKVAMQYSPNNAIPYVSIVDGGTIDLVRSFGVEVVTSANLVSVFESHLSMDDYKSHCRAGESMQYIKDSAFEEIARRIKSGNNPTEYEIYEYMIGLYKEQNMVCEDGPIVAVNEHAADPHFEPQQSDTRKIQEGDLVLIDLWAKKNEPGSIYYDITWMGYVGTSIPEKIDAIFQIARSGREAAVALVRERFAKKQEVCGMEVDDACRKVITDAGYGQYFIHRTGHNIGEEVHGNGCHIDNLETKDERVIIPGTCFSIEPGIYMPEQKIGFRTEIDVFVTDECKVEIFGKQQEQIIPIMNL